MKPIPLKDGSAGEIDPLWVKEWCDVYWKDDVLVALEKARVWCLDNPQKCKTKRGLRAFLGNWIRRDCRLKPQARMIAQEVEDKPVVKSEIRQSAIEQMKELLK